MTAWNQRRLASKLRIDYPIIQGPLGGLSSLKQGEVRWLKQPSTIGASLSVLLR